MADKEKQGEEIVKKKVKGPLSAPVNSEPVYLIVNPRGTMHVVTGPHAKERLKQPGWHLASAEEKEAYKAANGAQRFDKPLGAVFNPTPSIEDALPLDKAINAKGE